MSRIRTVKPEWLEDERIALASSDARVLSISLLLLADDYGNGRAHPSILRSRVFPSGTQEQIDTALAELVAIDFVRLYVVDGQRYFHVRSWSKHQRVDKPSAPRVPPPPGVTSPQIVVNTTECDDSGEAREDSLETRVGLAPDLDLDQDLEGEGITRVRAASRPLSPLDEREADVTAARTVLVRSYVAEYERRTRQQWGGRAASETHIHSVAVWVAGEAKRVASTGKATLPDAIERVVAATLRGFFAAKKSPWRMNWLAEDPAHYARLGLQEAA